MPYEGVFAVRWPGNPPAGGCLELLILLSIVEGWFKPKEHKETLLCNSNKLYQSLARCAGSKRPRLRAGVTFEAYEKIEYPSSPRV